MKVFSNVNSSPEAARGCEPSKQEGNGSQHERGEAACPRWGQTPGVLAAGGRRQPVREQRAQGEILQEADRMSNVFKCTDRKFMHLYLWEKRLRLNWYFFKN